MRIPCYQGISRFRAQGRLPKVLVAELVGAFLLPYLN
jgi:hypothetical protein